MPKAAAHTRLLLTHYLPPSNLLPARSHAHFRSMSTQVPSHLVRFGREQYRVTSWEAVGDCALFRPDQFGIVTKMLSTGCNCGFRCIYEIAEGILSLSSLEIMAKDGRYPLINDVAPSFPHGWDENRGGSATYDNIGLILPFTGTLRFVAGLHPGWLRHRSDLFGPSEWMYCLVYEAAIANGCVQSVRDLSAEIAAFRDQQL